MPNDESLARQLAGYGLENVQPISVPTFDTYRDGQYLGVQQDPYASLAYALALSHRPNLVYL